jgi:hypothetical protein
MTVAITGETTAVTTDGIDMITMITTTADADGDVTRNDCCRLRA